MISVWKDAKVPVEYNAPEFRFQNWGKVGMLARTLQTFRLVIVIVISLLFVVVSYYIAPKTLPVQETPIVSLPKHFLVVGHTTDSRQLYDAISFLYSNFPQFTTERIKLPSQGGSISSFIKDKKYLEIYISLPKDTTGVSLRHLHVLIPIHISFPIYNYSSSHNLLRFQFFNSNNFDKVEFFGSMDLHKLREFNDQDQFQWNSTQQLLENSFPFDGTNPFNLEQIIETFDSSPFSLSVKQISKSISTEGNGISLHFTLRIPEVFIEVSAPFWNIFKETYVQVFYWFWLCYFVWKLFIKIAFKYGIVAASYRRLLEPNKPHFD